MTWSTLRNVARTCSRQYSTATTSLPPPRLDYRSISENVVSKTTNARNRKAAIPDDAVQSVSRAYKEFKSLTEAVNAKRNARSLVGERIQRLAKEKDESGKAAALQEAKKIKDEVTALESQLQVLEDELLSLALAIPNDTHPCSPLGPESESIVQAVRGPTPLPASPERDHVSVGRKLGLLDLESSSTVTGSSWFYLLNEAALLEIALTNYALSIAVKHGYTPVMTPDVVRSDIASRCGFRPRDNSDPPVSQMYHLAQTPSLTPSPELVLSGTAEIPLAGMFANKILSGVSLPSKVVGLGRAFRAEAGARGADTRGLYRVHQFSKLELFAVTAPEESEKTMDDMKNIQMEIYDGLKIPYRILDMATEELGASAYRKYDMEAWMPGRAKWGEISSLSNCTDYQARRLHIRYRPATTESAPGFTSHGVPFAHTLNGTAAAIPRLIVALIENGVIFNENGEPEAIQLPAVLKPFWVGESGNVIRWSC